jgi:hypothetical protein
VIKGVFSVIPYNGPSMRWELNLYTSHTLLEKIKGWTCGQFYFFLNVGSAEIDYFTTRRGKKMYP